MAFWKKEADQDSEAPAIEARRTPPPQSPPARKEKRMAREEKQTGEINALLGRGASFEGKLTFEGTVRIDGVFKGEIHTEDVLVIGDGAKIEAEIHAGSVMVNGEVHGDITAKKSVDLHRPAKVYGNITTPALEIEKGVLFEGSCTMNPSGQKAQKAQGNGKPADKASQQGAESTR